MRAHWTDIGLGTDAEDLRHLGHLAITGNDSSDAGGSTSTVEDDDETKDLDEDTVDGHDDTDTRGQEDEKDAGGRRRGRDGEDKGAIAFRELQSKFDRAEGDKRQLQERLAKLEQVQTDTTEKGTRHARAKERAMETARRMVAEIAQLDEHDPERSVKLYAKILEPMYSEVPDEAEEISRRTSREELNHAEARERAQERAKVLALKELDEQGLDDSYFQDLVELTHYKNATDPGWLKVIPDQEQIPYLVGELKKKFARTTEKMADREQKKREHRESARGVIGEGSRGRRGTTDQPDDREEGPGSMLGDMARLKKERKALANTMLTTMR